MNVLYEDNHLLVVDKPAGMVTMGGQDGAQSVHHWAGAYLKRRYQKPGNVYVGIVSRLDRQTTGVLVLARTSKAAARLSIQFGGAGKSKKVQMRAEKTYLAIIDGDLSEQSDLPPCGELSDSLWKDDVAHRMRVDRHGARSDSKLARLNYQVISAANARTLIAVKLITGKKHQIRVQFADRGFPILGDTKYGAITKFPAGIALHSWKLMIQHPTTSERMEFQANIPQCWYGLCRWIPNEPTIESIIDQAH